jgi:hypothetical protein
MKLSSPKFKAFTVSAGLTFWFVTITTFLDVLSIGSFLIFVGIVFPIFQILAKKVSNILDYFAIFNTKIFLGILFVTVISLYGIFFKLLQIDLLRLKQQKETYWLDVEQTSFHEIRKQY